MRRGRSSGALWAACGARRLLTGPLSYRVLPAQVAGAPLLEPDVAEQQQVEEAAQVGERGDGHEELERRLAAHRPRAVQDHGQPLGEEAASRSELCSSNIAL